MKITASILASLLFVSGHVNAWEVQSYGEALFAGRFSCGYAIEPGIGDTGHGQKGVSFCKSCSGSYTVLGGQDGYRRSRNECQTANQYFEANPKNNSVCVFADILGTVVGAGSLDDGLIQCSREMGFPQDFPARYVNACMTAEFGPVCFNKISNKIK